MDIKLGSIYRYRNNNYVLVVEKLKDRKLLGTRLAYCYALFPDGTLDMLPIALLKPI